MKSSIQTISDLIKWAIYQGFDGFNFFPLEPTFENWNEDLIQNRRLLDDIQGYEKKLIEASNLLGKNGFDAEKTILSSYIKTLCCEPTSKETLCSTNRISIHDLLNKTDVNAKKIAIWGTGSFYRLHIADWLYEKAGQVDFMGFIDNNPKSWGKTCDGFPIYSPNEFKDIKVEPDFLIIAVYIGWKNQVIRQYREMGFNDTIIS